MKRSLNIQKISIRLTFKYTLFIFVTLVIMSVTTLFVIQYYVNNQADIQLANISHAIMNKIKSEQPLSINIVTDIAQVGENIDINITKDSEVIFKTREDFKLPSLPQNMLQVIRGKIGENKIVYYVDIFENSRNETYVVETIKDMDNELDFIQTLSWILVILNIVAFLVSILLGFIMSRRALEPIEKIVIQAKSITVSDLSQRIVIDGPDDELKRLADTFNAMITRIEKGYEKQNRFVLDASHELATPLAVIKGYVEILGRWGKKDPLIMEEAIESMNKEILNITKLLDALLDLSKNDLSMTQVEWKNFWIQELINEVYKESQIMYPNYLFVLNINTKIPVIADQRLIKQMLRAIIDNSVKYSKEYTTIFISCEQKDTLVEISIKDEGIGIDKEDLPQIFERFYRVDKARSRDIGGFGLGLSIVKGIADMHRGLVEAESEPGHGTLIRIILPISDRHTSLK